MSINVKTSVMVLSLSKYISSAFIFVTLGITPLHAETPIPSTKPLILETMNADKDELEARVYEMEKDLAGREEKLERLRKNLVSKTKEVQMLEKKKNTLNAELKETEKLYERELAELRNNYSDFSQLITTLYQLQQLPPELLMLDPEKAENNLSAYITLESIEPKLRERITSLQKEIDVLVKIKAEKKKIQANLSEKLLLLSQKADELEALTQERNREVISTNQNLKKARKQAERAAKNAQSLSELLSNLAAENQKTSLETPQRKKKERPIIAGREFKLPVQGKIVINYGDKDNIGAVSNGVHITSAAQSIVTTPAEGDVRYSGTFKNYGNMMIIEHAKSHYSLIAGLGTIDAIVGQHVSAGEPIGKTRNLQNEDQNVVYYELRRAEKPIDPLKALKNL